MPNTTIGFGIALIIQGLVGYFATGKKSKTALIPAFPGSLLALLGALGHRAESRRTAMHLALGVGLLGSVGAFMGRRRMTSTTSKVAAARALMSATCATYIALSTRDYVAGRCAEARHQAAEA
ncbi:MAG: hypothetical protein WCI67_01555 [Chloroflexales bacterium]